jgi:hypothetical protein
VTTSSGLRLDAGGIKGAAEAKQVFTEIPDDLKERLPKGARALAGQLAGDIRAAFPHVIAYVRTTPTGQTKIGTYAVQAMTEVSTSDSPVGSVGGEQVPLFRVVVDGLNATFADMSVAGVHDAPERVAAVESLNRNSGFPSRFAWPVAHRARARANAGLERTMKQAEKVYTGQLREPSA